MQRCECLPEDEEVRKGFRILKIDLNKPFERIVEVKKENGEEFAFTMNDVRLVEIALNYFENECRVVAETNPKK